MAMHNFVKLSAAAAILMGATAVVPAQAEYPEKPVEFVVPWPPGDLEDILTRMIAEEFQETYGVPAAVVNKPGGGGGPFPGAIDVATAPADGNTVGSFVIDVPVAGPEIGIPELTPNPFVPVGIFLTYPFLIAVPADAPYDDIAGLAAYAKEHDVALGHFGAALVPTQLTFALAREEGFDFASDAAFDNVDCNVLASGDVDVMNTTIRLIQPCIDDIKILATIGSKRTARTPDVPTVMELHPELNVELWNGLFVHKDTPPDVIEKIAAVAEKVVASDKAQEFAKDTGALIYWQDMDTSNAHIQSDIGVLQTINEMISQ